MTYCRRRSNHMAKKPFSWTGEIDGNMYHMEYQKPFLIVNGESFRMSKLEIWAATLSKEDNVAFDQHTAKLVCRGRKFDVALRGFFLSDGAPCIPVPKWADFLASISVILFWHGLWEALTGFLALLAIMKISRTSKPLVVRIAICLLIFVAQVPLKSLILKLRHQL